MFEGIELFSSLSKDTLNTLEMFCQERFVKNGDVLFNKGDESNSMYIVKTGKLEAYDENGFLGFIYPQGFVGEMSLFSNTKIRTASVRALIDSNLIVLLGFSIEQLGIKHPEILDQIKLVIEERRKQNNWN